MKLDKLDKLSRALQQERTDLQATIKKLSKPGTTDSASSSLPATTMTATVNSKTTLAEDESSNNAIGLIT